MAEGSTRPVRIAVLGTGRMAANHVDHFRSIDSVTVVAGIDTRQPQLASFCDQYGIANRFSSLEDALHWGEFDALANVTPDAAHHATTLPVLAAGKHILCEKPLATSEADAIEMAEAARHAGVVAMVNLSYRRVEALQKAARIVASGALGTVRHFEASYLQSWLTQPAWGEWSEQPEWLWRLSTVHGSKGVLGDVGIHILDYATYVAGQQVKEISCRLANYDKAPGGRIGEYVLDANDSATMQITLENGALGTLSATRYASGHINDLRLRIYGEKGGLEVMFEKSSSTLNGCFGENLLTGTWEAIPTEPVPTIYETFIAAIRGEASADPGFERGAQLQRLLDRAERSAEQEGLTLLV
ncbi:MAG: Gfo/Idh/MocA family oxidoreductase [Geminicoccaceae bacterium]|nr:Gfo/Idh/MocA family oxidoreductase [Geminicoccaceae bacterium]